MIYLLTFDRAAVDGEVTEVGEELLGTVLALDELEELGGVVDELWPVLCQRGASCFARCNLQWSRSCQK